MKENKYKTLYICYFGLREPLVQTQVLPYLREIVKLKNVKVSLLTFEPSLKEKWTDKEIEIERQKLAGEEIEWHCLAYHKRFSIGATFYDVLNGTKFIVGLHLRGKIDVLHARAHIPALMAMMANKFTKSKILFDIRGLVAEEYVDAGIWRENSAPFNLIKYVEREAIKKASEIVVLTSKMRNFLIKNGFKKSESIEVVPCCVDFSRIDNISSKIKKNQRFTLIYAGSVTGLYLLKEMGLFFLELKKHKPDAFFQILTASPLDFVSETLERLGITEHDYSATKVSPKEIPDHLSRAHLGISFRTPTFSQIAASPTKIPEYLACGLPVISNTGIGDTDDLIRQERVGVIIENFSASIMGEMAVSVLEMIDEPTIAERCVAVAQKWFDLSEVGGQGYRRVYDRLLNGR